MRLSKVMVLASVVWMQSFASVAQTVDFLTSMEDIPLPDGVVETSSGVAFQSPWGRVIQTSAGGQATLEDVQAFYDAALPELGWIASSGPLTYQRRAETLRITAVDVGGTVDLTFRLVVQPASSRME